MFLISRNKRLTFLSLSLRLISSSITTLNAPTTTVQENPFQPRTRNAMQDNRCNVLATKGCIWATTSRALTIGGRLSTSEFTPWSKRLTPSLLETVSTIFVAASRSGPACLSLFPGFCAFKFRPLALSTARFASSTSEETLAPFPPLGGPVCALSGAIGSV